MAGTRMNTVYKDLVPASAIVAELRPVFAAYRRGRFDGESLGDFCHRVGIEALRAKIETFRT